ncbi:MAG: hypothetical protein M3R13_09500 [Armatimonadota bacterium]|nr:hypothetical protein [Armatimonadota bacterium]
MKPNSPTYAPTRLPVSNAPNDTIRGEYPNNVAKTNSGEAMMQTHPASTVAWFQRSLNEVGAIRRSSFRLVGDGN